jgi:hypothetical protein
MSCPGSALLACPHAGQSRFVSLAGRDVIFRSLRDYRKLSFRLELASQTRGRARLRSRLLARHDGGGRISAIFASALLYKLIFGNLKNVRGGSPHPVTKRPPIDR